MNEEHYISLKEIGYTEFTSDSTDSELISMASNIGEIIKHPNGQSVFTLKAKLENDAIKGTFSGKHGLNNFPLHTDTAFYKKPARYILMHSVNPSNCDTTLLLKNSFWDLMTKSDKIKAERAIYLVKTNQEKFYTSFIFRNNNEEGFKYDPSCMSPVNKYAKEFDQIFNEILLKIPLTNIKWSGNKTIVIDNWNILHGRKSAQNDIKRELKRIYIN
jgi:hypothetical protein